jgi:UDP-glucose 4-epimerase
MKYVVTGGAGFIGSHIIEFLVERGDSVLVLDNFHTGKESNLEKVIDKIEIVNIDIRDSEKLKNEIKNVDGIFHQAALASVQESFTKKNEYLDVNVKGTENIFLIAQKLGLKVVYASSSSVYGNPVSLPIKESDSKNPFNPYAETKLVDDQMAEKLSKNGLKAIGLRYFNVFGERQSKEYAGVVKLFLEKIQNKMPPKINGDGSQSRDFVFVEDVVKANIMSMESKINHTFFNVGTGKNISVLELANVMIKAAGLDLEPIHGPVLEGDVSATLADITHIKKSLDWNPTISIEEWLEKKIANWNN